MTFLRQVSLGSTVADGFSNHNLTMVHLYYKATLFTLVHHLASKLLTCYVDSTWFKKPISPTAMAHHQISSSECFSCLFWPSSFTRIHQSTPSLVGAFVQNHVMHILDGIGIQNGWENGHMVFLWSIESCWKYFRDVKNAWETSWHVASEKSSILWECTSSNIYICLKHRAKLQG